MINFNARPGYKYTIIWTVNVREVQRDYPYGKIMLLDQSDAGYLIAIEEKR